MRIIAKIFFYVFVLLSFETCQESVIPINEDILGYDFFPMEIGRYQVYAVTDIDFVRTGVSDTSIYYLKVEVTDSTKNADGSFIYYVAGSRRETIDVEWQVDSLWQVHMNNYIVKVYEENIPIVRLSFPIKEGRTWDSNAYNHFDENEFEIANVNDSFSANDSLFQNTVTVINDYTAQNFVNYNSEIEVYAKNVGLIYKEIIYHEYDQQDYFTEYVIDNGRTYIQEIIEFGID